MKQMKTLILGILLGAFMFGGTTVWAATTGKIDVQFLDLKYVFDGKEQRIEGDVKGFIYKGTTYVPLRFAGESLGKKVTYDGKNKTIYVGKQPEGTVITKLVNLSPYSAEGGIEKEEKGPFLGVDNVNYYNSMRLRAGWSTLDGTYTYVLNGDYKTFNFSTLASSHSLGERKIDHIGQIQIYADDKLVLDTYSIPSHQLSPTEYEIDVEGVIELKIDLLQVSSDFPLLLIEPTLTN